MKPTCEKCRWWEKPIERNWGDCHRYPPQITENGDTFTSSLAGDWCGEFEEAEHEDR